MGRTWKEFMAEECGYDVKTTFWDDFTLAERHGGVNAVKETYQRAFKEWHNNVEYVTELAIVLNHKIWQHYEENYELGKAYNDLWIECDAWCHDNLKGDDATYYFSTTD